MKHCVSRRAPTARAGPAINLNILLAALERPHVETGASRAQAERRVLPAVPSTADRKSKLDSELVSAASPLLRDQNLSVNND